MVGCKYQQALKCEKCTHLLHRECKSFVIAHAKYISRELQPFIYSSKFKPEGNVMWSKDQNRAKSLALTLALKHNRDIKKLTISQVIFMALNNEVLEDKVIYIECATKLNGDVEKLKGVVTSFIESSQLNNTMFVIFVAPTISLSLEYPKI